MPITNNCRVGFWFMMPSSLLMLLVFTPTIVIRFETDSCVIDTINTNYILVFWLDLIGFMFVFTLFPFAHWLDKKCDYNLTNSFRFIYGFTAFFLLGIVASGSVGLATCFADHPRNPQVAWILAGTICIPLLTLVLLDVACRTVYRLQSQTDERLSLIHSSKAQTNYGHQSYFV